MKIYTKTGDDGTTALLGGARVLKCDQRISVCGTIDELNAALGVVRSSDLPPNFDTILDKLQNQLFEFGAELASQGPSNGATARLDDADVQAIELWIDSLECDLPKLTNFILPGGIGAAANLHFARCICRRAEREIIALAQTETVRETLLKYINRLSDLLFVLARSVNHQYGCPDVEWRKR